MSIFTAILFLLSSLVGCGSNTFVLADSASTTAVLATELSTMSAAGPTQARACQDRTLVGIFAESPRRAARGQLGLRRAPELFLAAKGGLSTLGRAGSKSSIRVAEGGSSAAEKLFGKLSKGGVDVTPPGHPGKLVRLPDGGFVGFRGASKSGPPTIDVNIPGVSVWKIKFPE